MANRIFISYRREDSRGSAGRLYDQLADHFGRDRIFMDVDAIQPGLDFVDAIEAAIGETDVLIVVMGPSWLTAADSAGRARLENPEDFVHVEVSAALERNIRVIPVLVERASMPRSTELPENLKSLARRNALEISHTRFHSDTQRLIGALEIALEQAEAKRAAAAEAMADRVAAEKADAERIDSEARHSQRLTTRASDVERVTNQQTATTRQSPTKDWMQKIKSILAGPEPDDDGASPDGLTRTGRLILIEGLILAVLGVSLLVKPFENEELLIIALETFGLYWLASGILALLNSSFDQSQRALRVGGGIVGILVGLWISLPSPIFSISLELVLFIIGIIGLIIGAIKVGLWKRSGEFGNAILGLASILFGLTLPFVLLRFGEAAFIDPGSGALALTIGGAVAFVSGLACAAVLLKSNRWIFLIEGAALTTIGLLLVIDPRGLQGIYTLFTDLLTISLYWLTAGVLGLASLYVSKSNRVWKQAAGIAGIAAGLIWLLPWLLPRYAGQFHTLLLAICGLVIGIANMMRWRGGDGRGALALGITNLLLAATLFLAAQGFSPGNVAVQVYGGAVAIVGGLATIVVLFRRQPT